MLAYAWWMCLIEFIVACRQGLIFQGVQTNRAEFHFANQRQLGYLATGRRVVTVARAIYYFYGALDPEN
jgi:hypothetical protein